MAIIQFKGKQFVQNYHFTVPYHELAPDRKKSLSRKIGLNDNLIIHGDNLLGLKALLPIYAGKVKCIYIDPPYNTGNEHWVYNDSVNSPMMKEWLGKEVGRDDLTRHDKWLCMMMPRLKLLRELLRDDGIIFVSIDDNEQHHLRSLMDDVFGEENFITNIIWQKKYTQSNDAKYFSDTHDFIIVFTKRMESFVINPLIRTEEQSARYENPDNDPRGPWMSQPIQVKTPSEKYIYEIVTPTGKKFLPPNGRSWQFSKERYKEYVKDNRIWFGFDGLNVPRIKKFLSEVKTGVIPKTIWLYGEVGSNDDAKRELKELVPSTPFDSPKPVSLIKRILQLSTDKDSIILDSFAGSGTTAHAVLALNKEDGGNRKFILVECEDYADKITAERVRRVIKGVKEAKDENLKNGLGGSFSFFELGKSIDVARILKGKDLPSFTEMARYIFYTATGEEFNEKKTDEKSGFIGESKTHKVYLLYKPDLQYLKSMALTLDFAQQLGKFTGKKRLVFAPTKYLDQEHLERFGVEFAQLPFDIYNRVK